MSCSRLAEHIWSNDCVLFHNGTIRHKILTSIKIQDSNKMLEFSFYLHYGPQNELYHS